MTSRHNVAVLVASEEALTDFIYEIHNYADAKEKAALLFAHLEAERQNQAKALSEAEARRERMWCTACGTVTRNGVCDCNQYQAGHEMCREPSFVNYADECSKDAREQFSRAIAAEARLADKEAELSIARQINHDLTDGITGTLQKDKIESLEARLAEAISILEFYAEPFEYIKKHGLEEHTPDFYDELNTGERAQDFLRARAQQESKDA